MSENVRYTAERLGKLKIVPDFLPPPEDLVFREEGVKVTIALSKRSVEFFKDEARRHNTQYQRMIRRLLDACGLPFEDACLSPHTAKGAVSSASSSQVRKPINADGMGAWQRYEAELLPLRRRLEAMGFIDVNGDALL